MGWVGLGEEKWTHVHLCAYDQWRFHAGDGGSGPRIVAIPKFNQLPKFSRTLDAQKISKFDDTKCQILRLNYTKFDFGWGPP